MIRYDDELIALLLGDRRRSPALGRWLGTLEGRRELRAYRQTLEALQQLYGDAGAAPRRTVYYCAISTPIGRVFVAASEAGLARVSFRQSEVSFVAELRQRLGGDVVRSPARTADVVHQLHAYFAGERRRAALSPALVAMRYSQARELASGPSRSKARWARRKASWHASSASWRSPSRRTR